MRGTMRRLISQFIRDEQGQDVVEYSLFLVLIGAVALIFLSGMGLSVNSILSKIGLQLENVAETIS
jgi:Flp pilus assembly pilin Flp